MKLRDEARRHVTFDAEDDIMWDGQHMPKYKVFVVWESIRERKPLVSWSSLLWSGYSIPRNSVLLWTILKDRISTLDKVVKWNPSVDVTCSLCSLSAESRDHLFVSCAFSMCCLQNFFPGLAVSSWDNMVDMVTTNWGDSSTRSNAKKLGWCAVVSELWRERCRRVFAKTR
ncbi:hypothetical protein LINPERHAP1_LOCUS8368, partial [Linum perenne]